MENMQEVFEHFVCTVYRFAHEAVMDIDSNSFGVARDKVQYILDRAEQLHGELGINAKVLAQMREDLKEGKEISLIPK
jgi:hypothetical protein